MKPLETSTDTGGNLGQVKQGLVNVFCWNFYPHSWVMFNLGHLPTPVKGIVFFATIEYIECANTIPSIFRAS